MIKDNDYILSNGVKIPAIAFGTWQIQGDDAYNSVQAAIKAGYRHIDTAANYENEEEVGRAINDLNARKDIFLATKLRAEVKSYDGAIEEFNKSLEKLGTDYLDLYMIHAPWPWSDVGSDCTKGNIEAWKALIDLYEEGKVRAIGVSNFHPEHIDSITKATGFAPMSNQIRFFIGNTQEPIVKYCKYNNILIEAYSPLATGKLMEHPVIEEMASKYGVSKAAICIRYCIERGTLPLVKSTHPDRIEANTKIDYENIL